MCQKDDRSDTQTLTEHFCYSQRFSIDHEGNWKILYYSQERKYYLTNQVDDPYEYENLYQRREYKALVDERKLDLLEWTLDTPWYVPVKPFSW